MNNTEKIEIAKSKILKWITAVTITAMTVSGFGQMPIFKRYYISDIPGMGWTADYYITHNIHYTGAVILLGLFSYFIAGFFLFQKNKISITKQGIVIIISLAGLVFSGILKVISNHKGIYFGTTALLSLDLIHTAFTFLFLIFSGIFKVLKYRWFEIKE